ncbi:hypothetical protein AS888_05735 [Peribacillus simplex]|uniref:DUF4166 domain-containing protein n=1 Tax=Peribacillus simplex TaxID=1478 RepID=A0A120GQX5_9BACI|nr:DUF4166 domain-containing protein [Peribacillus simplex]KWW21977.1 hypothetical protein AS888_05735 [Peribacillus simplex]
MTIYQDLLGEDFQRLHPKLQERYALPIGKPFNGVGTMSKIETGAGWLKPFLKLAARWKFLFPENGKDVPFSIKNTCRSLPTGEAQIHWERTFYFEEITRHFNAFMTVDTKRGVVKDYLGEPSLFYSDLTFAVTPEGRIHIHSGPQRIVIGNLELPIPRLLEGVVTVEEGYDDVREVFTIQVDIRNRIVGRLMAYAGEFKMQAL